MDAVMMSGVAGRVIKDQWSARHLNAITVIDN
jgi:hypothetical protein